MNTSIITRLIVLFAIIASACSQPGSGSAASEEPYPIEHISQSSRGMVVTAHPLASRVGTQILRKGGNAVDAAVAVQFALAVVYPRAGNIGGGGFMVFRDPDGSAYALDFREKAPSAAHRDMYLDSLGNVMQGKSLEGHLAVGVPGTVHGLYNAWNSLGVLPDFAQLVQPAIEIAQNGFLINSAESARLNTYQSDFKKFHDSSSPFLKAQWESGDTLIQKDLALTLQRIADGNGPTGFYSGHTADLIVKEMNKNRGLITYEDLASYQSKWRIPIIGDYRNLKIISMPPPSSGGVALVQLLSILEKYPISDLKQNGCQYMHLLTEAERRVYADRAAYLGDADFVHVPIRQLLDSAYLSEKMSDFDQYAATLSTSIASDSFTIPLESFETTHTSIVDDRGMAVSLTTTLNTNFGSKAIVNGAGFFLNNEMDDFSAKPGVPNTYGLIGNEANAIEPEKRMLSSMTPTIVEEDGKLKLVLGTPGGSTIITSVLQVILNTQEFDMPLDDAVFAPRFHHQWLPDQIFYEAGRFESSTLDSLESIGHKLKTFNKIGLVKAIQIEDKMMTGVGDNRSDDHAEGL